MQDSYILTIYKIQKVKIINLPTKVNQKGNQTKHRMFIVSNLHQKTLHQHCGGCLGHLKGLVCRNIQ